MAATNYTPIQLYYSTTASAAPTAGNLVNGELAINITDGKLYYKDNGGVVQVIATKGAGTIGGSNTQIQFNDGGALAGNAAMVFNKATNVTTLTTLNLTNALGAAYGGTAQSAYAQGDLLYASAVNTLSKLSIGTVNYILTSTGSVPQWVAPTSVTVQTANNLAGGAAGSVPYQSAADTTTFLAIGAANRVMTSTGSAPQWVTSLTGLTGVSSSSITNTGLTSGRVVYSGASGVQTDSANLTFNGTTLSAGGFSTTGNSTLVKLVTIGDSGFTTGAVLAAATPAKLYIGTGAVTDGTSAGGATNTLGTITAFGQTQVIATNANVTYTNLATLYIAGAPTAGTNVTITNPYSLYIAAGAAYFGGGLTFAGQLNVTDTTDSSSTSTGSIVTAGGVGIAKKLFVGLDANIYGITVGRGAGAVSTNTVVGNTALAVNTTGSRNTAVGYFASLYATGSSNTAVGISALTGSSGTATGSANTAIGDAALTGNTSGSYNTAIGSNALNANSSASYNTAVGYQAAYNNQTGGITAVGYQAGFAAVSASNVTYIGNSAGLYATGNLNTAVGVSAMLGAASVSTGTENTALGYAALYSNRDGVRNTSVGLSSLEKNTSGNYNTAVGYQAITNNTSASNSTAVGYQAGLYQTGGRNTSVGVYAGGGASGVTTTSQSTFIGFNAGANIQGGSYLVLVGDSAGASNTTGSYNVAIGQNALVTNQSGGSNVAIGAFALSSNLASNNVAIGHEAGYASQTGAENAFFGAYSGKAVTTASYNTAIGAYALGRNETGASNVAVGRGSVGGLAATVYSASNNTGVGVEALGYNQTGQYNAALGALALYSNTTASNNTAVGYQAGYSNQSASGNTLVGYYAGYQLTGAENTVIGSNAGRGIATGAYGVFIGPYSGAYNGAVGVSGNLNINIGYSSGQYMSGAANLNTYVGSYAGQNMTTGSKNTILGAYNGNQNGFDIRTSNNYIVLSDGDGIPWWSFNGNNGTARLRQYGQDTIQPYMKMSGFGYSPSSYRAIVLGGQTTAGTYNTVAIGYDPATNLSGNFSGSGSEVLFQNNSMLMTPNGANNSFINRLYFHDYGLKTYASISVGGADPATSGYGISFPATQSASSDANTLDDYEEGTWSPVIKFGTTTATQTSTSASYTKIGRLVTLMVEAYVTNLNSGTGDFSISGFPFNTYSYNRQTNAQFYFQFMSSSFPAGDKAGYILPNDSVMAVNYFTGSSGTSVSLNDTHFTTSSYVYAQISYFTP